MTRALLLYLARRALATERGRQLLKLAAVADEQAGFALLEHLAAHFNARVELRE